MGHQDIGEKEFGEKGWHKGLSLWTKSGLFSLIFYILAGLRGEGERGGGVTLMSVCLSVGEIVSE